MNEGEFINYEQPYDIFSRSFKLCHIVVTIQEEFCSHNTL